jgi:hypothetical protein
MGILVLWSAVSGGRLGGLTCGLEVFSDRPFWYRFPAITSANDGKTVDVSFCDHSADCRHYRKGGVLLHFNQIATVPAQVACPELV